jgi:hypothetical protein
VYKPLLFSGVATDEELAMEHWEVDELRDKLKVMLNQEMSLAKAVEDNLAEVKQCTSCCCLQVWRLMRSWPWSTGRWTSCGTSSR